jgi:dolichol-phosphate mannosyltransferase
VHAPIWLIIPTYDEADVIESLVREADRQLRAAGRGAHRILVVDDDSPDGTGKIVDRLAAELDTVEVLHRGAKLGLGSAYREGFARALDAGARFILQMDADFSHDPAYLPKLLSGAQDADMVLGSRYVAGGGVADWGPIRRLVSRGGCLYARLLLGSPVRDLTGGLKCHRREVLEAIDYATIGSRGYAFQIEVTQRALLRGFRVHEIPIVFTDRREGSSKMSAAIALEAARMVPRLRRSAKRQSSPVDYEPLKRAA